MSAKSYKEAINIILKCEAKELGEIAIQIAKSNPSLFVKSYKITKGEAEYNKLDMKKPNAKIFKETYGNYFFQEINMKERNFERFILEYGNTKWAYNVLRYLFPKDGVVKKINAIRAYRDCSGMGLKESKHFIDYLRLEYEI